MLKKGPVSVLVAPLDWGLGHATRCIPIINELTFQGARVIIAASTGQRQLLKQEFPELEYLEIPGYEIRYKPGIFLKWALIFRIPSFLKQIRKERRWLAETVRNHEIDAVISDNRYGLYHENLVCVFITHRLHIQSGIGSDKKGNPGFYRWSLALGRWINKRILNWNYQYISKFSECWIPDQKGEHSISGVLSNPPLLSEELPIPVKYIGILSRFHFSEKKRMENSLLILISGPEPQRTQFEKMIFRQLPGIQMKTTVVRGLPGSNEPDPDIRNGIKTYSHCSAAELNELILESEYIVARSGYSTIMDLVKLRRNAILVPTAGQTEQEYLGRFLHEKKWMYSVSEKDFNLGKALGEFQKGDWKIPEMQYSLLNLAVEELIHKSMGKKGQHEV